MLLTEYSDLTFSCNQKEIIGSELDFYFPTLKLAIQINGPLHYYPIYGKKKLDSNTIYGYRKKKSLPKSKYQID